MFENFALDVELQKVAKPHMSISLVRTDNKATGYSTVTLIIRPWSGGWEQGRPLRDFCPLPEIWSENNTKISITIEISKRIVSTEKFPGRKPEGDHNNKTQGCIFIFSGTGWELIMDKPHFVQNSCPTFL